MEPFQTSTPINNKEFLVTGVSRSGRVRKKSSKLLDFQSPNEVEKKPKRTGKPGRPSTRNRSLSGSGRGRRPILEDTNRSFDVGDDELHDVLETNACSFNQYAVTSGSIPTPDSDVELDNLVADLVESVEAESIEYANNNFESKVRESLYMTEKANKRKILKNGKVVTGKMERKDKGKTRYTAYALWAREYRKSSKFSKNQDLDFPTASRRLGELWANVSNKEKSAWRRKAKQQSTKARANEKLAEEKVTATSAAVIATSFNNSNFLPRATTSRTRKIAERQLMAANAKITAAKNLPVQPKRKRNKSDALNSNSHVSGTENALDASYTVAAYANALELARMPPPDTKPIDAAAHLKLLGESLQLIGDRLKEHEGQIAISGSLSVLLDSLLCSMGPLLCLTTYIPGLEKKKKLTTNLAKTLDNIAYVMPGL